RSAPSVFSARLIDTPVEAKAPRTAPARPAPLAAERNEPAVAAPPPPAKDQIAAGEALPRSKLEAEAPSDDERRRFAPAPPAAAPQKQPAPPSSADAAAPADVLGELRFAP